MIMEAMEHKTVKTCEVEILDFLPQRDLSKVREEIIEGLNAKQKSISPKFFYDKKGSELFEKITRLEEYYPSRCEKEILSSVVAKLDLNFNGVEIVELGSGDATKISSVFRQLPIDVLSSMAYVAVDISQSAIEKSLDDILDEFELERVTGVVADFHHQLNLIPGQSRRLYCFLGSTIGNFSPEEVERFMTNLGASMQVGDSLLMGADLHKCIDVIELAYDDAKGVTAEFNKNILKAINAHIESGFDPEKFEHLSFYNSEEHRIEMHLKAKCKHEVRLGQNGLSIHFEKGETIHTENSYKFTLERLTEIGAMGNLKIQDVFSDAKNWFNLVHFVKA